YCLHILYCSSCYICYICYIVELPFPELILDGHRAKTSLHVSSLSIFCFGCKTISRRTARRLIVLHPKQNIESELKWQTCSGTMPSKVSCSSGKGLKVAIRPEEAMCTERSRRNFEASYSRAT